MKPEYVDVFMRDVRFLLLCNICGALVTPETIELHDQWHSVPGGILQ